jgi:hypothetical protein
VSVGNSERKAEGAAAPRAARGHPRLAEGDEIQLNDLPPALNVQLMPAATVPLAEATLVPE